MNMNIPRIEVDIDDDRIFQTVCLLVDRPDFLADAQKIRAHWRLDKIKPKKWRVWDLMLLRLDIKKKNQLSGVLAKGVAETYRLVAAESEQSILKKDLARYERDFMEQIHQVIPSCFFRFMFDIYGLFHKYKAPPRLFTAIKAIVVCWRVTNKDIEGNLYGSIFESKKLMPILLHGVERVIITDKSLSKNQTKKFVQEVLTGNRHLPRRQGGTIYDIDFRHYSIRNMRDYYWDKKLGLSIKQIADKYPTENERNHSFEDYIKKNHTRYRQLLNRKPQ